LASPDDEDDVYDLGGPPRAPNWSTGRIVSIVVMVVSTLVILTVLATVLFRVDEMRQKLGP